MDKLTVYLSILRRQVVDFSRDPFYYGDVRVMIFNVPLKTNNERAEVRARPYNTTEHMYPERDRLVVQRSSSRLVNALVYSMSSCYRCGRDASCGRYWGSTVMDSSSLGLMGITINTQCRLFLQRKNDAGLGHAATVFFLNAVSG